jgi:hypothetical protein
LSAEPDSAAPDAGRSRRAWSRLAGWAGFALLVGAALMAARPSRVDRRIVLDRYSPEYAGLIVFSALAGAWCLGGLVRPGSRWGEQAGRTFQGAFEIAGIAVFVFGASELMTRMLRQPLAQFTGGPALTRDYDKLVTFNSHNVRDPERPLAKPPGTWRMVVLGDSFMFGQGVPDESTCVRHLERRLQRPGGPRVEVINTARVGYNTAIELTVLDTLGLRYQPDLVLLGFVLNDAEEGSPTYPRLLPGALDTALDWSQFYYLIRAIVFRVQVATGAKPEYDQYLHALYDPEKPAYRRNMEALHAIVTRAGAAGIPAVVAVWPYADKRHPFKPYLFARERDMAIDEARAAGAHAFDLYPTFENDTYASFALSNADSHPNPDVQRRGAEAIHEFLVREGLAPGAGGATPVAATLP